MQLLMHTQECEAETRLTRKIVLIIGSQTAPNERTVDQIVNIGPTFSIIGWCKAFTFWIVLRCYFFLSLKIVFLWYLKFLSEEPVLLFGPVIF